MAPRQNFTAIKKVPALAMRLTWLWVSALFFCLLYANGAFAQAVGKIANVSGPLLDRKANGIVMALAPDSPVDAGDILETEKNTYARIKFIDDSEMLLKPGSQIKIDAFHYEEAKPDSDNSVFSLIKGGLRSVTGLLGKRNKEKFKLNTPAATIGIRGTNFGALFCQNDCGNIPIPSGKKPQNGLYVDVSEGAIIVANAAGQQQYQVGQFGYVANLNTPPVVLPPVQGIPATMPLSISKNAPDDSSGKPDDIDCMVR